MVSQHTINCAILMSAHQWQQDTISKISKGKTPHLTHQLALYAPLIEGISTEHIPNPNSKNAPTTDSTARSAMHSANVSSIAASRPAASYPSVDICTSWQSTGSPSSLPCLALPVNRRSVMWHSCDVSETSIAQKNAQRQRSFSLPFCPQTPLFFSPPVRCAPSNCCPATPCPAQPPRILQVPA